VSATAPGESPDAAPAASTPGDKCRVGGNFSPGVEHRVEVTPPWPFRLNRRNSMDGLTRVRNGVIHRLLHIEGRPSIVRVAQLTSGDVLFGATEPEAIARMRRALWVDLDMAPFHAAYRTDPWIGDAVRADPTLRPMGRPYAFEALVAAITEQLIEYDRAVRIQRRIHARFGPAHDDLRDSPTAAALAGATPARLESFDLIGKRAVALSRVSRAVALGRVDLESLDPAVQEAGWRRLASIPNIGSWTIEMTALTGQGRIDQVPAGDLGFLKLAGRLASGGDPHARGTESEVRALFARFGEWKGLAGAYALRSGGMLKRPLLG
jgi:3-methyladenine DNA glycosylase/8-oxoguanine DNA glycosylase